MDVRQNDPIFRNSDTSTPRTRTSEAPTFHITYYFVFPFSKLIAFVTMYQILILFKINSIFVKI